MAETTFTKMDCLRGGLMGAFASAALTVVVAGFCNLAHISPHEVGAGGGAVCGILTALFLTGNIPRESGTGKFALSVIGGGVISAAALGIGLVLR